MPSASVEFGDESGITKANGCVEFLGPIAFRGQSMTLSINVRDNASSVSLMLIRPREPPNGARPDDIKNTDLRNHDLALRWRSLGGVQVMIDPFWENSVGAICRASFGRCQFRGSIM